MNLSPRHYLLVKQQEKLNKSRKMTLNLKKWLGMRLATPSLKNRHTNESIAETPVLRAGIQSSPQKFSECIRELLKTLQLTQFMVLSRNSLLSSVFLSTQKAFFPTTATLWNRNIICFPYPHNCQFLSSLHFIHGTRLIHHNHFNKKLSILSGPRTFYCGHFSIKSFILFSAFYAANVAITPLHLTMMRHGNILG